MCVCGVGVVWGGCVEGVGVGWGWVVWVRAGLVRHDLGGEGGREIGGHLAWLQAPTFPTKSNPIPRHHTLPQASLLFISWRHQLANALLHLSSHVTFLLRGPGAHLQSQL